VFPVSLHPSLLVRHALTGVAVSHISHLGAVLALYFLIVELLPSRPERCRQIAFTTACLHILSPAGIFLSAPYGESSYAFASFLGTIGYAFALQCRYSAPQQSGSREAFWTSVSGLCFGLSAMIRGNGVLNGSIFALDALASVYALLLSRRSDEMVRLLGLILGGTLTGIGFILPQLVAYQRFCTGGNTRPWCTRMPPSIYDWVQQHYWNVGLFNYWTLSNLPLFLLAIPMLLLLLDTGFSALHHSRALCLAIHGEETPSERNSAQHQADIKTFTHIMERLAVPQLVLAVLAFTSFHVQIINRISSGYLVWSLVLAIALQDHSPELGCGHTNISHYSPFRRLEAYGGRVKEWVVRAMVMYAIVQGGLFASFLPPA
jgi:phosphatidylinositol glycan class V